METINKKPVEISQVEIKNLTMGYFNIVITTYDVSKEKFVVHTFRCDDWYLKHLAAGITSVLKTRRQSINGLINDVKAELPFNNGESAKIV